MCSLFFEISDNVTQLSGIERISLIRAKKMPRPFCTEQKVVLNLTLSIKFVYLLWLELLNKDG